MDVTMKYLIQQVVKGECVLFLGSGSSAACESPSGGGLLGDGLARAMVRFLGEDPGNFNATLMEISEYVEATHPKHRGELDKFIYDRLHDLRPTIGHLLLARFPWRAIVTTNYNRAVETGFEVAHQAGVAKHGCVPFRTDAELSNLQNLQPDQVPLFKPHGCLSLPNNLDAPMVLTAKDYYESTKTREKMYAHVTTLAERFCTLFVGYSLVDYNFNNIYFELQERLEKYLAESWSVIPVPAHKAYYMNEVYSRRSITLIDDKFDTFLIRLAFEAGLMDLPTTDLTVGELLRPQVVQALGTYARALPPTIAAEVQNKGVAIP